MDVIGSLSVVASHDVSNAATLGAAVSGLGAEIRAETVFLFAKIGGEMGGSGAKLGVFRYGVFVPALIKDHEGNKNQYAVSRRRQYAVSKLYGNKMFWKISNVVQETPDTPYPRLWIRRLRKKYRLSLKNDMPPRDK
ncbi:hypothetical protein Tco_0089474 [Tanacetum coccineum]